MVTQLPLSTAHNVPEFTVSEISNALKRTVESTYDHVRVRGEISGFKGPHGSGHLYFTLKDENAVLDAVCWKGSASKLSVKPSDGLEVIATGRLTTFPGRSKYQIIIESMEVAGQGALLALLEERKKKLAAEGLFEESRKKPLPFLPDVIGVVTSPTGAVIRDILHRLGDRFPRHVLVWPVLVQGEGAAEQIAAAIRGFNSLPQEGKIRRPDVLIVARGGGSLEDLWCFNEEIVVRAAAESEIPLISAVGHETDYTLIDFVSDRRAPTPTGAAEMVVPVRADLQVSILGLEQRLVRSISRLLENARSYVQALARGLLDPRTLLENAMQKLDDRVERLINAAKMFFERKHKHVIQLSSQIRHPREVISNAQHQLNSESRALQSSVQRVTDHAERRLQHLSALLESYSYEKVLQRGFSLVCSANQQPLTSAKSIKSGQELVIKFADGEVEATAGKALKPKQESLF